MTDEPGQDGWVDGNMLAGPLSEVFAADMTAAMGCCASCETTGAVAGMRVFAQAPGLVGRCPVCGEVLIRLVRTPGAAWLEMSGIRSLRIALPEP